MQTLRWSTGGMRGFVRPNLPTEFEQVVNQLGLKSETEMLKNRLLFNWVSHNRAKRYVPESILNAFNMSLRDDELYLN